MAHESDACTCWQFPLPTGEHRPAARLFSEDRVAITSKAGDRAQGIAGVVWQDADTPFVSVDLDDSKDSWSCAPEDVASVEVVSKIDADAALKAVRAALADPNNRLEEELLLSVVTGDHETVEITVQRRTWSCCPSGAEW